MHTIKPMDTETLLRCAKETGNVVTVEEHSINGGLGGAVAEVLLESGFSGKFKRVGLLTSSPSSAIPTRSTGTTAWIRRELPEPSKNC